MDVIGTEYLERPVLQVQTITNEKLRYSIILVSYNPITTECLEYLCLIILEHPRTIVS